MTTAAIAFGRESGQAESQAVRELAICKMEALIYMAVASAVLGGIGGWFSRGHLYIAVTVCGLLSVIISAFLLVSTAKNDGLTWEAWPVELIYCGIALLLVVFVPCFIAGIAMTAALFFVRRHPKSKS